MIDEAHLRDSRRVTGPKVTRKERGVSSEDSFTHAIHKPLEVWHRCDDAQESIN